MSEVKYYMTQPKDADLPKTLPAGTRLDTGAVATGELRLDGRFYAGPYVNKSHGTSADNGTWYPRSVLWMTVPLDPQPAEEFKRHECDACGHEVRPGYLYSVRIGNESHPVCQACFNKPYNTTAPLIQSRREPRPQDASGSAGSDGVDAPSRTGVPVPEAKPVGPGRPSAVDPYQAHRLHIEHDMGLKSEDEVAEATAIQKKLRRESWTEKQRQAAEQLLRPATPKRYREVLPGHPSTWPEDAYLDAGSSEP